MASAKSPPFLVGQSAAHIGLLEKIARVAAVDAEVLISGPTGVGKELYARLLHSRSARAGAEFAAVDCGAIPSELFESEMFGHARGAYTGAIAQTCGLVASAESGTLFLDEVDSLSAAAQVKLLRFIQRKEYRRLGEPRLRRADVRIVAATNTDLAQAAREGRFREDLYYRLSVVPLAVPPLRERVEDVPLLLEAFRDHYASQYGLPRIDFSAAAMRHLQCYSWPGNIRELENCVRHLTCLQIPQPIEVSDLAFLSGDRATNGRASLQALPLREAKRDLIIQFEREYLESKLINCNGNIAKAARASGKDRRAFFELMRKHGLTRLSARSNSGNQADEPDDKSA